MRYHFTRVRAAIIKNLQTITAGEGLEKREHSCTVNEYSHQGRQYRDSLKKLGIKSPYDPGIPLLGTYPEETKIEKDTCIPQQLEHGQPRCPSTDEQIKKLWYIYTIEYYSAIKRNGFESVLVRWVNLEPVLQSEVSQKRKMNMIY